MQWGGVGGCLFEAGRLLTFSPFRMGAYSNKYGTSKTPLSISFNIQTRAPGSRSLKTRLRLVFQPTSQCLDIGWNHACRFWYISFKLVNYTWSYSQKQLNENHSGQVDESWYHHIFIWGETCFSSQIKDLHFNSVLLINTTHGNNENNCCSIISYCFIWKDIMVLRFHLFLGVWNPWWNTLPHFLHVTQKSL